jgi:transposase-like protein
VTGAELTPAAWQHVEQYANNPIEADQGRLKRRQTSARATTDRTAEAVIAGHAFLQNLRRGHSPSTSPCAGSRRAESPISPKRFDGCARPTQRVQ